MTRSAAAPLLGVAVVVAVACATLAARHAHPAEVSPVTPPGVWNGIWTWSVVLALVFYAAAMLGLRRDRRLNAVVAVTIVVQTLPLFGPLLLSKDVYGYWATARVVTVHHDNPYRTPPSSFSADPSLRWASTQWSKDTALYGPGWEALALAPAAAAGSSHRSAQLAYRLLALIGVLTTIAIVAAKTRNAAAVALLGWNPLVALHFAGGGHGDSWLVLWLVTAVAARRLAVGGAAWPLAATFKAVPAILLPLELAASRFRRTPQFWFGLVGGTIGVLAVSAATWGLHWIPATLVGIHATAPLGVVHVLGDDLGMRHRYAVALAALIFAVVYIALLVRAWRTGRAGLSLAATALCLTTSLVRPWYAIWPVALAAIEEDEAAAAAAILLSAYFLLGDAVSL